ncbi:MAG: YmdB family metallophosphoesterase [Acidobacteriia bacterium]|nr:YmdB family metallophosphoesterase [Terriglobia bacterium]
MNILFIGDIFASTGRGLVARYLQEIISTEKISLAVANAENSAGGFGITPLIAEELFSIGLDVLTSGNHVWDKKEIFDYLPRQPRLLRPANYPKELPGQGLLVTKARNGVEVAVIDLQGRAHMPSTDCPFHAVDQMLASLDASVKVRLVDFHAELTSEKMAMGWHLNGRVSAVLGTHTHIPTADERILAGGTAYQTDVGMTGPSYPACDEKLEVGAIVHQDVGVAHHRGRRVLPVFLEEGQHRAVHQQNVGVAAAGRERGGMSFKDPRRVSEIGQAHQQAEKRNGLVGLGDVGHFGVAAELGVADHRDVALDAGGDQLRQPLREFL